MIRILLVDDQNLVQQGIKSLLDRDPDIKVVGTVTDGRSAVTQISELRPDVVLLDIEMPGMNGITVTKYITHLAPETKVIILSSHEEKKYLTQALMAGAKGYILKSSLMADLKQSIVAVNNGYSHIESKLLAKVFDPSNFKVSHSKKASDSSFEQSKKIKHQGVAKTSVVTKAENAVSKSAPILADKQASVDLAEAPILESPSLTMGEESTISLTRNNEANKTVPKIKLPYAVDPDLTHLIPENEFDLVGQMVYSPETHDRLPSSSIRSDSVYPLSKSVGNQIHKTFSVTVNGKQYIQQLKMPPTIVRYQARLKQLWQEKVSPYQPKIDRTRSKIVTQYRQQVMPLLKKWHKKGWLANIALGTLGLIMVIIIHQVFS